MYVRVNFDADIFGSNAMFLSSYNAYFLKLFYVIIKAKFLLQFSIAASWPLYLLYHFIKK